MATPTASFAQELDRIAARYESQFAGQSRASRNIDEIDAIIADTEGVLKRVTSIPAAAAPKGVAELAETARQNITLYKNERQMILQAKNSPPEAEAFAPLAASANLVFARWHRNFAGQSRGRFSFSRSDAKRGSVRSPRSVGSNLSIMSPPSRCA